MNTQYGNWYYGQVVNKLGNELYTDHIQAVLVLILFGKGPPKRTNNFSQPKGREGEQNVDS